MARAFDPRQSAGLTTPLPGRDREQRELLRILENAERGSGSVLLISGEAGIGKTTLVERLTIQARRDQTLILPGNCYATATSQPFFPWRQLHKIGRDSGVPLDSLTMIDSAGSREEAYELIADDLRGTLEQQPALIIIEDIHWADTASLELLRHLARRVQSQPVLLVATCRSDEPEPAPGLRQLLPEIVRESRAERIELRRLDLDGVREFVQISSEPGERPSAIDWTSLSHYLHERSGGNPLFMTELLREMGPEFSLDRMQNQPVPLLIRQVIENRIDRIDERHRSWLEIASVIGQEVPIGLWHAIVACDDDELASVIEASIENHVLRESSDGQHILFAHGLIQETLYSGQISLRRRSVHRQIAEYLADRRDPPAATVALHFARAGDSRGVEWFIQSAEEALGLYAARDAIGSIDQAERLASDCGVDLPLDAYRLRAVAREMLGEDEQARTDLSRLLQGAREIGDREAECRALIDFGMLWAAQDYQQCGAYLQQALDVAETLPNESLRAQCINRLANWQANVGEFDQSIALHEQALRIFEGVGDQDGIADTLDLLGMTCFLAGDYPNARDYLERSIAISRDQGNKWRLSSSLAILCNIGGDMDSTFDANTVASRPDEYWTGAGEESIAITREIGWISGESFGLSMLGAVHCVRGNLREALDCAERAEAIAHRIQHQQWLVSASLLLGVVWSELLDHSRAEYYLERTLNHARAMGSHLWTMVSAAALANTRLQRGDTSGRAQLQPFLETEREGSAHGKRAFQFAWANQLLAGGEHDEALKLVDQLLEYNEPNGEFPGTPQILKLKGDVLAGLERPDEASELYEIADRVAAHLGFRSMRWRVQLAHGVLCANLGKARHAERYLDSAREIAVGIAREVPDADARGRFIREVDRLIDAAREPVQAVSNPAGLSPREIDVLRLVSRGYTDAQVAEELFISPRTVARHLQSIYTKLNVHSRTQATRLAMDQELIPPG